MTNLLCRACASVPTQLKSSIARQSACLLALWEGRPGPTPATVVVALSRMPEVDTNDQSALVRIAARRRSHGVGLPSLSMHYNHT